MGKLLAYLAYTVVCLSMATDASPPYRFGNLLALARQSWVEQVAERMQEAGFPGYRRSDAGVLGLLLQRPLAIGQLGEALGVSRQAARQLADGLAGRGYVSFQTDQADSRRTLVVLTPSGTAYGRAIWMAQDALNEMVRNRVSEADLAAADGVLRAVFPDDEARQRVDERLPPLRERQDHRGVGPRTA
jgi:DNA-binding MarR family transcriptional regulator